MERSANGQFAEGATPHNKFGGEELGTKKIINFKSGNRRMIKVKLGENNNYMMYSRYLIEKSIGRKLKSTELVHHINEDKLDDRIENLKLETMSSHVSHHRAGKIPVKAINLASKHFKDRRDSWKLKIMGLYQSGLSIRKITNKLPLSRNTITKIIRGGING